MSDYFGTPDRKDFLRDLHTKSRYAKRPRRVRKILDEVFTDIVEDRAFRESELRELVLNHDLLRTLLPQDTEELEHHGFSTHLKLSSSTSDNDAFSFFC